MLAVTGEEEAAEVAVWKHARFLPTHTVSIGGLNSGPPSWWGAAQHCQKQLLRLEFDDVEYAHHGYEPSTPQDMQALLTFLLQLPPDADLLIHCAAGFSRSTACAWIGFALHDPKSATGKLYRTLERCCALGLRDSTGHRPNRQVVWLASRLANRPDWRVQFKKDYLSYYPDWTDFAL